MLYKFRAQGRSVGANKQMNQFLETKMYKDLESKSRPNIQNKVRHNCSSLDTKNTMTSNLLDYSRGGNSGLYLKASELNNYTAKGFCLTECL